MAHLSKGSCGFMVLLFIVVLCMMRQMQHEQQLHNQGVGVFTYQA